MLLSQSGSGAGLAGSVNAQAGNQHDAADHAQAVRKHVPASLHSMAGVQAAQWAPCRDARFKRCGLAWQKVSFRRVAVVVLRPASITVWGCWAEMELQSCSPGVAFLLGLLHIRHSGCCVCRCLSAMRQMLATAVQGQKLLRVSMSTWSDVQPYAIGRRLLVAGLLAKVRVSTLQVAHSASSSDCTLPELVLNSVPVATCNNCRKSATGLPT